MNEKLKFEVVFGDNYGEQTILEGITDIQVLNGVTLFFSGDKLVMGVSVEKLVYFREKSY